MKKNIHCLSVALLLACGTSTVFSMTTDDVTSLVDCYNESNYKSFLSLKSTEMLDKVTIWIETLLPTDGTFLNSSIAVGGDGQPADATRSSFVNALLSNQDTSINAIIDNEEYAFPYSLPEDNSTASFSAFNINVTNQALQIMKDYVDTLLTTNDTFLDSSIGVGGDGQPEDATRDAFKNALAAIFSEKDDATCLAECYGNNNYKPFLSLRSEEISDTTTIWVESLLPEGTDTLLDSSVPVGSTNQPADATRDAFINALVANQAASIDAIMDDEEYELPYSLPEDDSTESFSTFNNNVTNQVLGIMKDYVDTLLTTNDTFLDSSVGVGGDEQPADLTRDAFKDALVAVVEYGNFADGGGGRGGSFNVYGGIGGRGRGVGYGGGRGRGGRGGRDGYRGGRGGGRGGH